MEHHRQDHRGDAEADGGHGHVGQAEVVVVEHRQGDQRLVRVDRLPVDEGGHEAQAAEDHQPDPPGPVVRLPLLQTEHDAEHADTRQHHTEDVEPVPLGGKFRHQYPGQRQADDADRHVDEEDPLPTEVVDEHAAGQRTDQRRHSGRGTPHTHGRAAALRRKDPGDRGQGLRRQQRRAQALHDARGDQHPDAAGQAAPQRRQREHRQAGQVQIAWPEAVTEPARDEQRYRIRQQVCAGHPDDTVVVGAEFLHDDDVGDGDDRGVHQDHEEAEHHGPQGIPRTRDRSSTHRRTPAEINVCIQWVSTLVAGGCAGLDFDATDSRGSEQVSSSAMPLNAPMV